MDMKRFFLYAIAIAALALAGCGGNGGGGTPAYGRTDGDMTGHARRRDTSGRTTESRSSFHGSSIHAACSLGGAALECTLRQIVFAQPIADPDGKRMVLTGDLNKAIRPGGADSSEMFNVQCAGGHDHL